MSRCYKLFLPLASVAVVALVFTTIANAASFTVTPIFVAGLDPTTFDPIPGFEPGVNPSGPTVVQIDFLLEYEGAEGDFGAVTFDVLLENLTNTTVVGWQATNPTIDSNGGGVPGGLAPLFANNADLGIADDLRNITVGIASGLTGASDPRLGVGVAPGTIIGSLFLDWDGLSGIGTITTQVTEGGYSNGGQLVVDTGAVTLGGVVTLGSTAAPVPEPSAMVLAGLGLAGLVGVARRRRK